MAQGRFWPGMQPYQRESLDSVTAFTRGQTPPAPASAGNWLNKELPHLLQHNHGEEVCSHAS